MKQVHPIRNHSDIESGTETFTRVTYEYEGTGNNKVLKIKRVFNGEDELFRLEYTYDAQGDVIKKERTTC